jgi:hypothetical protein
LDLGPDGIIIATAHPKLYNAGLLYRLEADFGITSQAGINWQ